MDTVYNSESLYEILSALGEKGISTTVRYNADRPRSPWSIIVKGIHIPSRGMNPVESIQDWVRQNEDRILRDNARPNITVHDRSMFR